MDDNIYLNVSNDCSEETKEALRTALKIAAESLSNDSLSPDVPTLTPKECEVHAYYPHILSDGKVHCKVCGHGITDKEWWALYLAGKIAGPGI